MKIELLPIALLLFSAQFAMAQEEGALLAKSAETALASYNSDPVNNFEKLAEARNLIEESLQNPDVQANMPAWLTKGNIYNSRLQSDVIKRQLEPNTPLTGDNDALVAFEAYKKVHDLSQIINEKLEAIKGISEVQGHLINIGVSKYEGMEYEKSFLSFLASFESHELLKKNGHNSLLDNPQELEELVYSIGLAAHLANRCPDAIVFYEKLYHTGTDRPAVYEGLYACKQLLGDETGAERILTEGRKKFPSDTGLLFEEINYYLKTGNLNELTGRMEQAIEKEPTNVSLYVTLGNVYENLYQSSFKNNDVPKANTYFESAKRYYSNGMLKDPENLDAAYSLGALYYNKAAVRAQQMDALAQDLSKEGREKLNGIETEIMGLFDQSLPFFKKAESIDPNYIKTLIALHEIYSRKEVLVIAAEMKKRLEVVRGGGRNPSPYFQ